MATIDEIIAAVQAVPVAGDGSLTLAASDFAGIDVVQAFFTSVLSASSYKLAGAARTPGTGTITVRGQADVLGYSSATATVTFTTTPEPSDDAPGGGAAPPIGEGVTVSLTGVLSPDTPRSLPAVPWISVADVSVAATVAEPFNAVTYGFSASIVLPGKPAGAVPIAVAQVDGGLWMVAVAGQGGQSVTIEQLVALLGGQALENFLPAELTEILEGLALSDLAITFDPAAKTVASVSAGLTVTNGWTPAPGLELEPGLHLALSVQNPADETTRVFTAVVTGTFKIDTTEVPVFVQVDVTGGTSQWLTGLNPATAGVTLPSLSGLFTLAGGADFTQSLPSALAQLPGIQISQLLIGLTLSPAALRSVNFAAATTSAWPIIDGFLTVEQLSFGLTLAALDTSDKTVGGSLTAILDITSDVGLYFSCAKDPATATWTFSGGLPPGRSLNLTDLVAKLLARFVAIPPDAPALVLDTVDLTVVPGTSMTFHAGSVTPWPLLTGLVLDSFTLAFAYTSGAKDPFSGSLTTTMTVAQVPLTISAGLDTSGVWSLAGHTAPDVPIDVTHLVNDLTGVFGVPAVPADALGGLTIANLSVSFSAGSTAGAPSAFHFGCTGQFNVAGAELDITVAIELRKAQDHYTGTFTGLLAIKKADTTTEQIKVTFAGGKLTANWAASPGHGLSLTDLASCLGFTDVDIPDGLNLTLTSMSFSYDVPSASLSIGATTASGDKAVLVTAPVGPAGNQTRRFAFAVDLPLNVTLADLPLVGDKLPEADQLGIPDLGCWFLSGDLAGYGQTSDAATLNAQVPTGYPQLPETPLAAGLLLSGTLRLGSENVPLDLATGGATKPAAPPAKPAAEVAVPAASAPAAAASGGATTKWFTVQRSFGVFTFSRLGIQYADSTLYFMLDASIGLGPLELTTQGLGIGSPLTSFEPKFHLDGLGLAYDQPPLEIAGGFLAIPAQQLSPDVAFQYDGFAVVKAQNFALAAVGSYAQLRAGDPSLFVFAQLDAPLGGPPALFITGLMAGFGYNRSIALPAQDEVIGFPLLVLATPPAPGETAPPQPMSDVLAVLEGAKPIKPGGVSKQWIAPKTGEYWLAVGLQFTSFELVSTRALLIAQFGQDLAFALLGISTLRLPQGAPDAETYAYVELELAAILKPNEGVFGLTAVLGPASYVITPACHLTGGFAFFVWFGDNPNAGQFVITLGGYHPAFRVPSYFPLEPRLGFSWAVSDEVAIKGDAYFALTTSCVMAGGGLEITFQSGNLRAWFTAQMDVLISWRPFFFLAGIGVSIGVSYKLDLGFVSKTISVSVGASVSLWGPPTGGTVTVNLWIVSFTVGFGEPQGSTANEPLDPTGFAALLPPAKTLVTVTAGNGLTKTLDDGTWIVRASSFAFVTGSAIPATALAFGGPGGADTTRPTGFALKVRPMNLAATEATHEIKVTRRDGTGPVDLTGWAPAPVTRAVPESLWGAPLTDSQGRFTQLPQQATNATVSGAPVGATFTCPPAERGPSPGAVPETVLEFEPVSAPGQPAVDPHSPLTVGAVPSATGLPVAGQNTLAVVEQVAGKPASAARAPVVAALAAEAGGAPLYSGPTSSLSGLAAMVNDSFSAQPLTVGGAGMTATVQFFDNKVPPISGGDFVITVTQTATAIAAGIPPAQQRITFSAPQVTLDAAEVVQCSPPPSATGPFGDTLASVLLAEPSLPWERSMPAGDCPWLALLVFADGELSGGDPATHAVTTTAAEFLAIKDAVVPKITLEADVAPAQACGYIRVPTPLFQAVTPRVSELPWLAHVRQSVPESGSATELAVVMANRFPPLPAAGAASAAAVAHLVSVEGLTPWLTDNPVFTASGTSDGTPVLGSVVMLSLASWTFGVVPDPAESFQGLTLSLLDAEYDPAAGQHAPDRLALRLPLPPGYRPDAPDPGQAQVATRLTSGYVPLTYHTRSGEEAMAWYRGPVTPSLVAALSPPLPFPTDDSALIYDSAHGVFDVSLAAAWQIGRAAALADRSFGQALFSYRQAVQRLGDTVVDRLARPQFANEPSTDLHGLASQALGALRGVLGTDVGAAAARTAAHVPARPTSHAPGRSPLRAQRAPAGQPLLAALANPAVNQAVTDLAADALAPVAAWLAGLTLLEPLPFSCLVPDPRMLPRATPSAADPDTLLPGAVRFGYLDPNWTTALVTGALSLAVESSRQAGTPGTIDPAVQAAIGTALAERCGLSQPPTGPTSVLLLRSDLVSGWPTLSITPLDATGAAVPVLRLDRLAPGVLLALFDGIPATVRLAEPHAALTLGVDEQGAAELRNLRPPARTSDPPLGAPLGRTVPVLTTPSCLRPGSRVLAVSGLVAEVTSALSAQGQPVDAFGAAALALQLVRAPQEMTFDSATGGS